MSDIWTRARANARTLRNRLTLHADASAPATIAATLADAELDCVLRPPGDALLAGAHAVLDRQIDAVWVRDDVPAPVRTFLIAHELAHFHLHPEYTMSGDYEGATDTDTGEGTGAFLVGYGPRERRETEANAWARELLLPATVAHRLFYDGNRPTPEIAARFGVTQSVVFHQLQATNRGDAPTPEPQSPQPHSCTPLPLDPSQHDAATTTRCPLLVGAGPGTGKTRTLVGRVKHLLDTGTAPETVLVLTFSRKATAELRERFEKHLPHTVAGRVAVCTFHAFGLDLLRRYHKNADLPPNPVLLGQAEAFALMENRFAPDATGAFWFPHDPTYPLQNALSAIGRLKEEMVTSGDAQARAEASGDPKQLALAAVYARYETTLREKQVLDSADLVCRAVWLLRENAALRAREQARWQHLLVDEYQDVNRAGATLVQLLGGDGSGVWCVGDLRQAIYRFRGASPANVTRFAEDFPGGERRDLAVNYRSRPALVACLGQIAGGNAALWGANREGDTANAPCVMLAIADTEAAQVAGIAEQIVRLRAQNPAYRWRDFAVLCRTNPQAASLRAALAAQGVPVAHGADSLSWLRDPLVRELLLLLSLTGADCELAARTGRVLPPHLQTKTTPDAFLTAALYGASGLARTVSDLRPAQTLLALAHGWTTHGTVLDTDTDANTAFLRHVRRVARLGFTPRTTADAEPTEGADAVSVITVHAAKGLEFPVVFVPNLSAGRFPPQPRPGIVGDHDLAVLLGEDADAESEEPRLFFVAISRARDHLFLSLAERYDGRAAQPSSLLTPLGRIPEVSKVRWTTGAATPNAPPVPERMREPAAPVPDARPVPVHELDRYLRCPRRYFYTTVRGLGDTRPRTAYDALKSAMRSVLRGADADAAFAGAWEAVGLTESDPWHGAYRAEWQAILHHVRALGKLEPAPTFTLELDEGTVEARADGLAPDGSAERFTFAKSKEAGGQDAVNTFLFHAAPPGVAVRVQHVRTGTERIIEATSNASTRRARESHLAGYNRALRGIRLSVFPATPSDKDDCAECAYLLICD